MAKDTPPPAPPGPRLHLRDWLRQHAEHPAEAVAGFFVHVGSHVWDTAAGWEARWAAWWGHKGGAAK